MTEPRAGEQGEQWERVASMPEMKALMAHKRRFIVPATVCFLVYYFALPALVGYAPALMSKKVLGPLNLAYLFALSQFFMAWILAWLYVRAAARFDRMSAEIVSKHQATASTPRHEGEAA